MRELEIKLQALKESIDMIWEKVNQTAHKLYEGNGDSLTTAVSRQSDRILALEARCGTTCPMATRLALVEDGDRQRDEDAAYRRKFGWAVSAGVAISAITGVVGLAFAVAMALARSGAWG